MKEVNGVIFGPFYRIFVSLPVKIKQQTKNVHFLLDTGSPKTYICEEVFESFKVFIANNSSSYKVLVNNKPIIAHLPPINSHFKEVNLLGMEYLKTFDAKLIVDFESEYISISFGSLNHNVEGIVRFILFSLGLFFVFKKRPYFFFSVIIIILFYNVYEPISHYFRFTKIFLSFIL